MSPVLRLMPRRSWALVSLLLIACTGVARRDAHEPDEDAPQPQPTGVIPAVDPAPARPVDAPVAEAAPPRCEYPRVEPTQFPALRPASAGACRKAPAAVDKALRGHIREHWMREWPTGKLLVESGCDRLGGDIATIIIEASSGHGGSLDLMRFDRRDDGDYNLVLLEYNHYAGYAQRDQNDPWQADSSGPLEIHHARIARGVMADLVDRLRAAAHVQVEEREPPPKKDTVFMASAGFSSNDHHLALRLVDGKGFGVERFFAGYAGTGEEQKHGVPLEFAAAALWDVLGNETIRKSFFPADAADPAARELFAGVFWAARARGDDYGYWYVRERLLGMTALVGGPQHVPALLGHLRPGSGGEAGLEVSVARSRVLAINAIAALIGFDLRRDGAGKPRAPEVVEVETLAACERR